MEVTCTVIPSFSLQVYREIVFFRTNRYDTEPPTELVSVFSDT